MWVCALDGSCSWIWWLLIDISASTRTMHTGNGVCPIHGRFDSRRLCAEATLAAVDGYGDALVVPPCGAGDDREGDRPLVIVIK